jgi:hypothetical protein
MFGFADAHLAFDVLRKFIGGTDRITYDMLCHGVFCALHVACCMLHVVHCMLHVVHWMLDVAYSFAVLLWSPSPAEWKMLEILRLGQIAAVVSSWCPLGVLLIF